MNITFKLIIGLVSLCFLSSAIANGSCTNENTAIPFSTPSSDFTIHDNGTVTHNATGLMWMRCSIGQTWKDESCTGAATLFWWQRALTQNGTNYAGYSDWRVPNIKELSSIVELRCHSPSINEDIFPATPNRNTNSRFWSSSTGSYNSRAAWYVDFYYGSVNGVNKINYPGPVRLVRASQ